MSKLTIKNKLYILIALPIVVLLLSSAFNVYNAASITSYYSNFLNKTNETEILVKEARINILTMQKHFYRISQGIANSNDYTNISVNTTEVKNKLELIKNTFEGNEQYVVTYDTAINEWIAIINSSLDAIKNNEDILGYMNLETEKSDLITKAALELEKQSNDIKTTVLSDIAEQEKFGYLMTAIISVTTLVISLIIGLASTRSILIPITLIVDAFKKLRDGDLNETVHYEADDELGVLAKNLNETIVFWENIIHELIENFDLLAHGNLNISMRQDYIGGFAPIKTNLEELTHKLNITLSQIDESSIQVKEGSQQIANASLLLAQGATEQAGSIEELSSAIIEVSNNVSQNAKNAAEANQRALDIGAHLNHSNSQMNEMLIAMEVINAKSSEIENIIKTIDAIAFQTNILALNAAVEAARAGSSGRGFAVVADEVRNLASKSAIAAKDTHVLINDTIAAVRNGTTIANETANSLNKVVQNTTQIVDLIDNINVSSSEQATSISQISIGLEQISQVIQSNSATSEEDAAAAEELLGLSELLHELITTFELIDEPSNKQAKLYKENIVSNNRTSDVINKGYSNGKYD